MRFGSLIRYFISVMYIIQMVLWMSVVLYSPVIAINVVAGLPIEPTIIVFGAICSFYSAIGGLKGVLWADVFQISLMLITVLMLFAAGIKDAGGLVNVIERVQNGGRLNFFNFQVDFVTRYTFWNGLFQGILCGFAMYGINQTIVQRLLSLRNIERAKSAALWSNPVLSFVCFSACLHGIVLYAVYFSCDPVLNSGETGLTSYDQLVPYFLISKFHSIPGLTGLSVVGLFSGSLSSVSSILNSLATVTVVDFVHPIFKPLQKNEKKSLLLAKGLSLAYGAICICTALSLTEISSISQAGMLFQNTFEGPILAIFILGVLTRRGFGKSVLFGLLPGFFLTQWIGFSSLFSGYYEPPLPLNTSMCTTTFNLTYDDSEMLYIISPNSTAVSYFDSETSAFNKMPYFWIRPIGFVITFCSTCIVIFISDRNKVVIQPDSKLLSPVVKLWTKNNEIKELHEENISLKNSPSSERK